MIWILIGGFLILSYMLFGIGYELSKLNQILIETRDYYLVEEHRDYKIFRLRKTKSDFAGNWF